MHKIKKKKKEGSEVQQFDDLWYRMTQWITLNKNLDEEYSTQSEKNPWISLFSLIIETASSADKYEHVRVVWLVECREAGGGIRERQDDISRGSCRTRVHLDVSPSTKSLKRFGFPAGEKNKALTIQ